MTNPTGTTYLSADLNYVWQDGDVYQIPQTDTVEAAAPGASFNGLGVANQPHQELLNKAQWLRARQLADEANIASLESMLTLITSGVGPNGWLQVGSLDTSAGTISIIWQWGSISVLPYGNGSDGGLPVGGLPFSFPIPFTTVVWMVMAYWQTQSTAAIPLGSGVGANGTKDCSYALSIEMPYQLNGGTITHSMPVDDSNADIYSALNLVKNPNAYNGMVAIGWAALGY